MRHIRWIAALAILLGLAACAAEAPDASADGNGSMVADPGGDREEPSGAVAPGGEEPGGEDPASEEPGGEEPGGFSEPEPEIPTEDEFLARLEPIIALMAPPNATEVSRSLEEQLVLFAEWESSDSYEALDAYYAALTPPEGMEGGGGPTEFPQSSEYVWQGNDFQIGVTVRSSHVVIGFLGIPPAN